MIWRRRFIEQDQDAHRYVIEHDGSPIGFAQWYEEQGPEYRHAGMDLFLAPHAQGRGLGVEVVRLLARWLIDVRGHHRLVIDPAAANERAIRCYQRVGFAPSASLGNGSAPLTAPGETRCSWTCLPMS